MELAKLADVGRATIAAIENGKRQRVHPATAQRLARVLVPSRSSLPSSPVRLLFGIPPNSVLPIPIGFLVLFALRVRLFGVFGHLGLFPILFPFPSVSLSSGRMRTDTEEYVEWRQGVRGGDRVAELPNIPTLVGKSGLSMPFWAFGCHRTNAERVRRVLCG